MTQPDLDLFTALDWNIYQCQCHVHPCPGKATHMVELHAVHRCDDEGLNVFGNYVELLCPDCLDLLEATTRAELAQLKTVPGVCAQCDTCGAPIEKLGDVLRGRFRL